MARLVWNELMILVRDSSVLFWIFLFPFFFMFMMLFAFGSGGSLPQQTIEIVDLDRSALSQRYIEEVRRTFSGTESIPGELREADERRPVATGASRITVPEGFGHDLERQRPVAVAVSFAEDGLAAQLVGREPGAVLTLDDLEGVDPTAFTDGEGTPLPARSCDGSELPPGKQLSFDAAIDPQAQPSVALRDYRDFIQYVQSAQGHLNGGEGLCFVERQYPSPP